MPFDGSPDQLSRPQQILLDAAALIRQHGLARYSRHDERGQFCIHGAVAMAANGTIDGAAAGDMRGAGNVAITMVARYLYDTGKYKESWQERLRRQQDEYVCGLARWNNNNAKDAAEVVSVLESAAFHKEAINAV